MGQSARLRRIRPFTRDADVAEPIARITVGFHRVQPKLERIETRDHLAPLPRHAERRGNDVTRARHMSWRMMVGGVAVLR